MGARAVLFDLGDTLVRLAPFPGDLDRRVAGRLSAYGGGESRRVAGLAKTIAAAMAQATAEAGRTAARDEVDLEQVAGACLAAAGFPHRGTLARAVADAHGDADIERIHAVEGRATLLQSLRDGGLRLAVVSNTTTRGERLSAMLERFGLRSGLDVLVYSSDAGVRKPHAEIFQRALDALGVSASEAIFVGDRLHEDVLGPQAVGMRAILTREFSRAPHNGEPFAVVDRLEEVVPLVLSR